MCADREMLYARAVSHERRSVSSPEFSCNNHCYSVCSRPDDYRLNSHNTKISWIYLRPHWPACPNMLMCESMYYQACTRLLGAASDLRREGNDQKVKM